ncbi:hypothetical protein GCM10010331_76720 [Streptomyces xanthochromogenes]|nr:hypothetical protein GCM10010331_76720 [Streptomyces xanthochromogenes]
MPPVEPLAVNAPAAARNSTERLNIPLKTIRPVRRRGRRTLLGTGRPQGHRQPRTPDARTGDATAGAPRGAEAGCRVPGRKSWKTDDLRGRPFCEPQGPFEVAHATASAPGSFRGISV